MPFASVIDDLHFVANPLDDLFELWRAQQQSAAFVGYGIAQEPLVTRCSAKFYL
jgi:hypothetical protein